MTCSCQFLLTQIFFLRSTKPLPFLASLKYSYSAGVGWFKYPCRFHCYRCVCGGPFMVWFAKLCVFTLREELPRFHVSIWLRVQLFAHVAVRVLCMNEADDWMITHNGADRSPVSAENAGNQPNPLPGQPFGATVSFLEWLRKKKGWCHINISLLLCNYG